MDAWLLRRALPPGAAGGGAISDPDWPTWGSPYEYERFVARSTPDGRYEFANTEASRRVGFRGGFFDRFVNGAYLIPTTRPGEYVRDPPLLLLVPLYALLAWIIGRAKGAPLAVAALAMPPFVLVAPGATVIAHRFWEALRAQCMLEPLAMDRSASWVFVAGAFVTVATASWSLCPRPREPGACRHCGYALGGLAVCPECGFARERRPRRRRRRVAIPLLVLVATLSVPFWLAWARELFA